MADITIACPKCHADTTVSEYAAPDAAVCRSCGAHLELPVVQRPPVRLGAVREPQPPPGHAPEDNAPVIAEYRRNLRRRRRGPLRSGRYPLASWLLFVLLGLLCYYLRHRLEMTEDLRKLTVDGALILLGALHLATIVTAFTDDMFQGILCLIIPFYSLYYLFTVSDAFFLRAVVAGLLVGYGMDAFVFLQEQMHHFYVSISYWLEHASISD